MKKSIFLLIILFSVTFLHAQNTGNNNFPLTNEEYFQQAELVFEGHFEKIVATYDTKGSGEWDDIYSIQAYKVQRVYKGPHYEKGEVVYLVVQGGYIGAEKISYWEDSDMQTPPFVSNIGIKSVNAYSPQILFFLSSDFPDDENSAYYLQKKYMRLGNRRLCVSKNAAGGLFDLAFSSREHFYNYMRQFEGFTVPETEPKLEK